MTMIGTEGNDVIEDIEFSWDEEFKNKLWYSATVVHTLIIL